MNKNISEGGKCEEENKSLPTASAAALPPCPISHLSPFFCAQSLPSAKSRTSPGTFFSAPPHLAPLCLLLASSHLQVSANTVPPRGCLSYRRHQRGTAPFSVALLGTCSYPPLCAGLQYSSSLGGVGKFTAATIPFFAKTFPSCVPLGPCTSYSPPKSGPGPRGKNVGILKSELWSGGCQMSGEAWMLKFVTHHITRGLPRQGTEVRGHKVS